MTPKTHKLNGKFNRVKLEKLSSGVAQFNLQGLANCRSPPSARGQCINNYLFYRAPVLISSRLAVSTLRLDIEHFGSVDQKSN